MSGFKVILLGNW